MANTALDLTTIPPEPTVVDLAARFGPMQVGRIRFVPSPGTATEEDVVAIHDREKRLCELVDGFLVEKTVGTYEALLATRLAYLLLSFVEPRNLGFVLGADGMLRLAPGLVRIPDVSFIGWHRLPDKKFPREPIASLVPDLAVEIISKGNTREEMDRKLADYFAAGVGRVWYVYPDSRQIHVHKKHAPALVLTDSETLLADGPLAGLELELGRFFAMPEQVG